ncbi:hypothetical protein [Yoonia sp.]|uniref:hypothetical protein n=1 Tax=Yoonia sp. TaxID=2212373 RepID=UPI003F70A663
MTGQLDRLILPPLVMDRLWRDHPRHITLHPDHDDLGATKAETLIKSYSPPDAGQAQNASGCA